MIYSLVTSIKNLASQGNLFEAFRTFSFLQLSASPTDLIIHPTSYLLLSCTNVNSLLPGKQLHAHIFSLGFEQHRILVPRLVTFYSNFNLLADASFITENSNIFHPLPWNLLIFSYIRNGFWREALFAYNNMVKKGIRPDNFTYPSVLKACGEICDLGFGRNVHKSIENSHHEWSLFVQNALISMYGKCGEVGIARKLFDKLPESDACSWNSMISCYASTGNWDEAFELFERMQLEGIESNILTWNTIAGGCLRTGNFKGALELLSQMNSCEIHLDHVSIIIGLSACSHFGALKLGKEIHGSAIRNGFDSFDNVKTTLITMYSRCKLLRNAYILFQLDESKSVITWNSMISGCTHLDRSEEASFLFREMLLSGVKPSYVTIASILPLCARVANLQHGKEFHTYIIRRKELQNYLVLWNALVDMYARSGKISEAKRVFNSLTKKDEVTFTSLIAGYGAQGEGKTALKLFEEMINLQIQPDHITMVAVLSACSHSGLVFQGQMLFERMQALYNIVPRLEHFSCMVDLYGRAGFVKKAEQMIKRMPYRPSAAMWATLIGACRIHGNTEIGEWAAGKLLEMKPDNSGYYVLIANMYAAAGCWNKLAEVRMSMRDLGVRKTPGCAWVGVGNEFSHFLVGDTSNPHAQEIYLLLDGLSNLMIDAAYVSTVNLGLCEVLED